MPPVLDIAIGVVFVFLLFSLVVSALNEIILSALDRRARFLKEGISELLRDTGTSATITKDKFFNHGIIAVLSRNQYKTGADSTDTTGVPSYIPGKSFVLALLSLLTEGQNPAAFSDLRATIEKIGNQELKETLLALYDDAHGNLDHFKANIENWFNEGMDRVGGWYKRYAQQWLLGLALLLAVACNVDGVRIIRALSIDPKLRESMVKQAAEYAKATPTPAPRTAADQRPADAKTLTPAPGTGTGAATEGGNANPAGTAGTRASACHDSGRQASGSPSSGGDPSVPAEIKRFQQNLNALGGTGLPIGWNDPESLKLFSAPSFAAWFAAIFGWAVMGLAGSLGAPFWFDLLSRFVDIRGVGRAPEESDPTAPKKPATGVESYVITGDSLRTSTHPLTPAEEKGETPQS